MKQLIILGTNVHAAEMAEIVERVNQRRNTWKLLGYIEHKLKRTKEKINGYPILGRFDILGDYPDAFVVPSNAWPHDMEIPQDRLVSLIDPASTVSRTAQIGAGCVIYPNSFIGLNARLGDRVFCLSGCIINHDVTIGNRTILASAVSLAGQVQVGEDCYLGQSCSIRQHIRVGKGSLVGMGSVVIKDIPQGSVMVGNPARRLRNR